MFNLKIFRKEDKIVLKKVVLNKERLDEIEKETGLSKPRALCLIGMHLYKSEICGGGSTSYDDYFLNTHCVYCGHCK